MKIAQTAALFVCFSALSAQEGQPRVIDPVKVAEKLLFPKDSLVFKDITEQTRRQLGPGVVLAEELAGKETNTFHPIAFVVAQGSSLMTPEFVRGVSASIEASAGNPTATNYKRFDLADGSWGYIGMEAMGPNGALIASTFTDAKRQRDIKITLACGFRELTVVPGGESYGKQFSGEIDATPALLGIVQDVVKAAQNLPMPTDAKVQGEAHAPSQLSPLPQTTSATATAIPTSTPAASAAPFSWGIAAVLLAFALIAIAALFRWRRK